jgi:mercuric ion binding protein
MYQIKTLLILATMVAFSMTAQADQQTIILSVDGMTCQSFPYQVKRALKPVEGVVTESASLEPREAEEVFDDAVTNIATLTQATTGAGFPSTLKL